MSKKRLFSIHYQPFIECSPNKGSFMQMLDAAHGEAVAANKPVLRTDIRGIEPQDADQSVSCSIRSRRPIDTYAADTRQNSRNIVAVARSRRSKAIAGMNAAKNAAIKNEKLKMKNYSRGTKYRAAPKIIHL
ncbi:MAG: hypothetical protein NC209_02995 [Alistipes sp.]|nr:hypothetical protein [Alistipes senegalensis]MCM1250096.1 hypothetical protein [Alistipes sp.]